MAEGVTNASMFKPFMKAHIGDIFLCRLMPAWRGWRLSARQLSASALRYQGSHLLIIGMLAILVSRLTKGHIPMEDKCTSIRCKLLGPGFRPQ